jgi:hypothetical protein
VEDVIGALAGFAGRVEIENIYLTEVDLVEDFREVLPFPGCEVINATHLITAFEKSAYQGGPDEAGSASHKEFGHTLFMIADAKRQQAPGNGRVSPG